MQNSFFKFVMHCDNKYINTIKKPNFLSEEIQLRTIINGVFIEFFCEYGLYYIRQTKLTLRIRLQEHRNYVTKAGTRGIYNIVGIPATSLIIHAKITQKCSLILDLDFYEASYIHKHSSS